MGLPQEVRLEVYEAALLQRPELPEHVQPRLLLEGQQQVRPRPLPPCPVDPLDVEVETDVPGPVAA